MSRDEAEEEADEQQDVGLVLHRSGSSAPKPSPPSTTGFIEDCGAAAVRGRQLRKPAAGRGRGSGARDGCSPRPGARTGSAGSSGSCGAEAARSSPTRGWRRPTDCLRRGSAVRHDTTRLTRKRATEMNSRYRAGARDPVQGREPVGRGVLRDAPRHPFQPEQVLGVEGDVRADEHEPERCFAEPLPQHPARDLRVPEEEAGESRPSRAP